MNKKKTKVKLKAKSFLCPMPLAVIGASVIGESNRLVISCCNVMNYNPEVISFVLKRSLKINESIVKKQGV